MYRISPGKSEVSKLLVDESVSNLGSSCSLRIDVPDEFPQDRLCLQRQKHMR